MDDITEWEPARLIPVSGINGPEEQERRGSSALLAVLSSVKEFGRAITGPLGAPSGNIETFIEVRFRSGDSTVRPDGLIRVTRGRQAWSALVEVKTGRNGLSPGQLESYLEIAREQQFDALLTISNQITAFSEEHPVQVDRKKLRKVNLYHLSWSQIHTEAVIQSVNKSVQDRDQAWILNELIRYLEHPRSGAVDFDDMGASWVAVRDGVANRTLRAQEPAVAEVVERFGQLVAFAAMRLSRELGVEVRPSYLRSDLKDLTAYRQRAAMRLVDAGMLQGAIRVPNAIAPFTVTADLRTGRIICALDVVAPGQGRNATRVNWLTRQMSASPDAVLIEAWTPWAREPGPCHPLSAVRERPELLFEDPKRELRSFTVRLSAVAGTKRGQGRGSFVGSVLTLIDTFYADVVRHIRPWTPPAPSPKGRLDEDNSGDQRDEIAGELPLRSIQRATTTSDYIPAESAEVTPETLVYTTALPPSERVPSNLTDRAAESTVPAPVVSDGPIATPDVTASAVGSTGTVTDE